MAFIEVDDRNFEQILSKQFEEKKAVILKFGSEFCDACSALGWELDDIEREYENISILLIDCNDSQALAENYDIYGLPTMIIYKDAQTMVYRGEGVMLSQDIKEIIEQTIK